MSGRGHRISDPRPPLAHGPMDRSFHACGPTDRASTVRIRPTPLHEPLLGNGSGPHDGPTPEMRPRAAPVRPYARDVVAAHGRCVSRSACDCACVPRRHARSFSGRSHAELSCTSVRPPEPVVCTGHAPCCQLSAPAAAARFPPYVRARHRRRRCAVGSSSACAAACTGK